MTRLNPTTISKGTTVARFGFSWSRLTHMVALVLFISTLLLLPTTVPAESNDDDDDSDPVVRANITFTYTFTMFRHPEIDLESAYQRVEDAAGACLAQEIAAVGAENEVQVHDLAADKLEDCSELVESAQENIGLCAESEGRVIVEVDEGINQDLVRKLSAGRVQTCITEFNTNMLNVGEIYIGYTSPIPLTVSMVLGLNGVRSSMLSEDVQLLEAELLTTLTPILAAGTPPFRLVDVKIVAQALQVEANDRRLNNNKYMVVLGNGGEQQQQHNRNLQEGVTGNAAEIILFGNCALVDAADNCGPGPVYESAKAATDENSDVMLDNLRAEGGTERGYFDRVEELGVNSEISIITINATDILSKTNNIPPLEEYAQNDTEEEKAPFWIWILIGGSAVVLITGSIWGSRAFNERKKEALLRQAFEENHRQSMVDDLIKDATAGQPAAYEEEPLDENLDEAVQYEPRGLATHAENYPADEAENIGGAAVPDNDDTGGPSVMTPVAAPVGASTSSDKEDPPMEG